MLSSPTQTNPPFHLWTAPFERFSTDRFTPTFASEVLEASSYIEQLFNNGLISEQHLTGTVVDFGCGFGGSSFLLAKNGANVTAVDKDKTRIEKTQELIRGMLDAAICAEGVQFLYQQPRSSIDFITAFMFGPDLQGDLSKSFYRAVQHALKDDGRLLVVSDWVTIAHMRKTVAEDVGVFLKYTTPNHPLYIGARENGIKMPLPEQDQRVIDTLSFFVP